MYLGLVLSGLTLAHAATLVATTKTSSSTAASSTCPPSYNRIPDGGFQNGPKNTWCSADPDYGMNVGVVHSARSPDGYACRAQPFTNDFDGDTALIGETIYACEGYRYNFSFWYRAGGDPSPCQLIIGVLDTVEYGPTISFNGSQLGHWYHQTFIVDKQNGNTSSLIAQFDCGTVPENQLNTTYIDIDDFSFTTVGSLSNPACPQSYNGLPNGGFEEGSLDHWQLQTQGNTQGSIVSPGYNGSKYAFRAAFHQASTSAQHGFNMVTNLTRACAGSTYDFSLTYRYISANVSAIPSALQMNFGMGPCLAVYANPTAAWTTLKGSCQANIDSVSFREDQFSFTLEYSGQQTPSSFPDFAIEVDNIQFKLQS